jgi:hypothetical protein
MHHLFLLVAVGHMIQLGHIRAKKANRRWSVCLKWAHVSTTLESFHRKTPTHTRTHKYIGYIYTRKILAVGRNQLGHTPSQPQANPKSTEVNRIQPKSSQPKPTPRQPQVNRSQPQVNRSQPKPTPCQLQVSPSQPQVHPSQPQVNPKSTQVNPKSTEVNHNGPIFSKAD